MRSTASRRSSLVQTGMRWLLLACALGCAFVHAQGVVPGRGLPGGGGGLGGYGGGLPGGGGSLGGYGGAIRVNAPQPAPALSWRQIPGAANDIGVGADGSVWVIGNDKPAPNDYGIYRLVNGNWQRMPGWAVRVAVDPRGNAWVINSTHNIFHWNGSGWDNNPGRGLDIGVGANGDVWLIGEDHSVWKWDPRASWQKMGCCGDRIAVESSGAPWIVNSSHQVWIWNGSGFTNMQGPAAVDIGVGGDGSVWVAATDGGVWRYLRGWSQTNGGLTSIAVDNNGNPWGVNASKQIWASGALPDPTAYEKGYLNAGESLVQGQYIVSPTRAVYTILQADGKLCTYTAKRGPNGYIVSPQDTLWCQVQDSSAGRFVMAMQGDGNLCTYRGTYVTYEGGATWCSSAVAPGGQFHVAQLEDGNLCVYKGAGPANNGDPMWCRYTASEPNLTNGYTDTMMFSNNTDMYAWTTVYMVDLFKASIGAAGCVAPHHAAYVPRDPAHVDHIRVEATRYAGCAHPVFCDISGTGTYLGSSGTSFNYAMQQCYFGQ